MTSYKYPNENYRKIDWDRIAQLLNAKRKAEGKVPFDPKSHFPQKYWFNPVRKAIYECYVFVLNENTHVREETRIELKDALAEVWNDLTTAEQNDIMANMLGGHVRQDES